MRYILSSIAMSLLGSLCMVGYAQAIPTTPSSELAVGIDGPFSIVGYSTTSHRLNYVQLYNDGDTVESIDGWRLLYDVEGDEYEVAVQLSGMISPGQAVIVADETTVPTAIFPYVASEVLDGDSARITRVRLSPPVDSGYLDHTVVPTYLSGSVATDTSFFSRNKSSSTGNFLTSFTRSAEPPSVLVQDELYEYPESSLLQIVEVLANSRNCSPLEDAGGCKDYVKLYNPTDMQIDLSAFRLRTGNEGQSSTASNTAYMTEVIDSGAYLSFELNLTNAGGWVWMEDVYGMMRYDESVIEYADAGSDTKKGYSWAQGEDGVWSWALPQPTSANRMLSVDELSELTSSSTPCDKDQFRNPETGRCKKIATSPTLTPCAENQYRSTDTNRCRNVISTASSLVPCSPGQYRSPETNRCRNIAATSASSLTPCKVGQYRSPETNRCRSVETASSQLKPCTANQERNPETNRCRAVAAVGDAQAGYEVVETPRSAASSFAWLALGGTGLASLGYAAWEWRREISNGVSKLLGLLPFVK